MSETALAPLRAALLARARASADELRADAEREARETVAAAEAQAAAVLADARAHGAADAANLLAAQRGQAHRAQRAAALAVQSEVYRELQQQTRTEVARVLAGADASTRLVAAVRARLGEDATIRHTGDGGVLGQTTTGRRVDASVAALVERVLLDLDLEQLWAAG